MSYMIEPTTGDRQQPIQRRADRDFWQIQEYPFRLGTESTARSATIAVSFHGLVVLDIDYPDSQDYKSACKFISDSSNNDDPPTDSSISRALDFIRALETTTAASAKLPQISVSYDSGFSFYWRMPQEELYLWIPGNRKSSTYGKLISDDSCIEIQNINLEEILNITEKRAVTGANV